MTQIEIDQAKRIRALEAENARYQIRERGFQAKIDRLEYEANHLKSAIRSQAA